MLPEPRRPPRDATPGGSAAPKGKGKGKGKNQSNSEQGRGTSAKGKEDFPPLPPSTRVQPKAKAKPANTPGSTTAPWAEADDQEAEKEKLFVDKRRLQTDPIYAQQMRVVLERTMNQPEALAQAEEKLEQVRARHESELPPDKRITVLRKRLRVAEASEAKLETKVQSIQEELDAAADRLHEAKLGLRAQKTRTAAIRADVQATETLLPRDSEDADESKSGRKSRTPMTLDEHLECVFQLIKGSYKLSETAAHTLESQLRGIEALNNDLARVAAVNEAEEKLDEERRAQARAQLRGKRDRSPQRDDVSDTPVAESENEEEADMKVDSGKAAQEKGQDESVVKPVVIGPIGTAPYGAQAPSVQQTATALSRGDRERSPRRDAEPAAPAAEEGSPKITAAQAAALRGDHIDSLDSLPPLVEDPPQPTSNPRGGDSLT